MALTKKYLISCNFIKQNTVIDINLSDALILPQIWEAQESEIQRILGSKLYDKLLTDLPNLTGNYKILVDQKISMCLSYYTLAYGVPFWVYEFGDKGIAKKTSSNSEAITNEDIIMLGETFRKRAEMYGQRLIDYLEANESKFPEYNKADAGDMEHEEGINYECPIALGRRPLTDQEMNYFNGLIDED